MQLRPLRILFLLLALSLMNACANIVPPGGGPKDITAPKLKSVLPADSQLNTRVTRIEMKFDEFITVADVSKELHVSPTLATLPTMTGSGKTVILKITDSLLQPNTTYTISFGNAIKDLHEGNPYVSKPYLFSTGAWFDSLQLRGNIYNAASGMTDSSATVRVLLYDASLPEDVVTRQKPAYVVTTDKNGLFQFVGLPDKNFRIFALKETGDNLQFDNDEESVAFIDQVLKPSSDTLPVTLSLFKEEPDSALKTPATPATANNRSKFRSDSRQEDPAAAIPTLDSKSFSYHVAIDTGDLRKRTVEINNPVSIFFSRKLRAVHNERVTLSVDSSGIEVQVPATIIADSGSQKALISTRWQPNAVYTLRLLKSFATDTAGTETLPSKYRFRTKQEEDYGKMEIHIPGRYTGKRYLLRVDRNTDSVYQQPVHDSSVSLTYLSPGTYKIAIIEDSNGDNNWTTGDLKKRRQPERVIPYGIPVLMKAGWEHVIDFEQKKK